MRYRNTSEESIALKTPGEEAPVPAAGSAGFFRGLKLIFAPRVFNYQVFSPLSVRAFAKI